MVPTTDLANQSDLNRDFRVFRFNHGDFCLHVPTSSVLGIPNALAAALASASQNGPGTCLPGPVRDQVEALVASLPRQKSAPPPPEVKPAIRSIALNIAQKCNLRCRYCFAGDGDYGHQSMMSEEVARAAVKLFASGQESLHVVFFGGEPLMNFALMQKVVAMATDFPQTRFTWSVTTNGTLMTKAHLDFFRDNNFIVSISYDGKGLQEVQRPMAARAENPAPSSAVLLESKLAKFESELNELRGLQLRSTVMKTSLHLLEDAILHTLTSKNYRFLMGYHATAIRSAAFAAEDVERLGEIYTRVVTRLLDEGNVDALMRFEPLRGHLAKIKTAKTKVIFCQAGVHYLSVSASGKFYLCHRFTEDESAVVGSITDGVDYAKLQQYANHRQVKHEPCNSCWMREWCGGGCFHENAAANGTTFRPDPLFCQLQEIELEAAMLVYTKLLTSGSKAMSQLK